MENTQPKLSRAQINQRIWQAIRATRSGDLQTLSTLVQTRAQANWLSPDRQGIALLSHAVASKQPAVVKWLLEKGANPNTLFFERRIVKLKEGEHYGEGRYYSPLMAAISLREVESIALLLEHGADTGLPVEIYYAYECDSCRDYLYKYRLEEAVQARREAMQFEKVARTPETQSTTIKARL